MNGPRSFALAMMVAGTVLVQGIPATIGADRRAAGSAGKARVTAARPAPSGSVARRPVSSPPTTARGRATYGYGHGDHLPYPPGGWHGGWYGYWGWGGWWYPSTYWPYWGWPYVGAAVVVPGGGLVGVPANAPGTLTTAVTPKRASVSVDGQDFGLAKDYSGRWDSLRLAPGAHVIEFSREGYQTYRAVVDVRPGRTYRIERVLRRGQGVDPDSDPIPATKEERREEIRSDRRLGIGFLDLNVEPADSAVYLDGTFLAHGTELDRLHGSIPLAAGTHRLEVVRPGHGPRSIILEITGDGGVTSLNVALEPEP